MTPFATLQYLTGAALDLFMSRAHGPTLPDLCDPLLSGSGGNEPGDGHLRLFYQTALMHPALRTIFSRAGLPQLADDARFGALHQALLAARDHDSPDWRAVGAPLAELFDVFPRTHLNPGASSFLGVRSVPLRRIDEIMRGCAGDLLRAWSRRGFIPTYAAFNLLGDPDFDGRGLVTALTGLNARSYKNATLLFALARIFFSANPKAAALIAPPWTGVAEPMWQPIQIRHRSAYYDAFFIESLIDYAESGVAAPRERAAISQMTLEMARFCLVESVERVRAPEMGGLFDVVTALVPPPASRMSTYFWGMKARLGFDVYVPDQDTTHCSFSAAAKAGFEHPIMDLPLIDLLPDYQIGHANRRNPPTVSLNDNLDFTGGVVTWIENLDGARPYGNDIDPTLNLDVLEANFRYHARWRILEEPRRLETLRRIIDFIDRLTASGAFADPRSHIYYLPELFSAYVGRCYEAFNALPAQARTAIDPGGAFERIRVRTLTYVRDSLLSHEINPFDAALGLLALAKLGAEAESFAPALACLDATYGEGGAFLAFSPTPFARTAYRAYEWNKMKTPTRILVGGPEVTSAFVLAALAAARKRIV